MEGVSEATITTKNSSLFARVQGAGPALLLLHGFPQTQLMWREVVPHLASRFTVVCADLRGYGRSACPPSAADHGPYSKRVMAAEMVELMATLGFERFMVAGHDRGGRVAYRMAADHPHAVSKLAVLDVVPTLAAWERADARLALSFWPWSLLSQPAPLPERLIAAAPDAVIDDALANWGTPATVFDDDIRTAYIDALRERAHVHAICEEYRAAAGIDREHDTESLSSDVDRLPVRSWRCGAGRAGCISGTSATVARLACGVDGATLSAAQPSKAATSSRKSSRPTQRLAWRRSSTSDSDPPVTVFWIDAVVISIVLPCHSSNARPPSEASLGPRARADVSAHPIGTDRDCLRR